MAILFSIKILNTGKIFKSIGQKLYQEKMGMALIYLLIIYLLLFFHVSKYFQ